MSRFVFDGLRAELQILTGETYDDAADSLRALLEEAARTDAELIIVDARQHAGLSENVARAVAKDLLAQRPDLSIRIFGQEPVSAESYDFTLGRVVSNE